MTTHLIASLHVPSIIDLEPLKKTIVSIISQTKKANVVFLVTSKENATNSAFRKTVKKLLPDGLGKILSINESKYGSLWSIFGPLAVDTIKSNDVIITLQSGIIYPPELFNVLYESHVKYPDTVICTNGHAIGKFPNMWGIGTISSPEFIHIEPGSRVDIVVGSEGVLYPKSIFDGNEPNSAMEDMRNGGELKDLNKFPDLYMSAWMDILKKEKRLAEKKVVVSTPSTTLKKGFWTTFKALRSRGLLISGIKVKWYKSIVTLSTLATLTAFACAIGVVVIYANKRKTIILKGEI